MEGLLAAFRSLGPGRILALFIGLSAVIAIGGFTVSRLGQPGMSLLYGGLSAQEANRITELLQTQNVPYELKGEGAVYVPDNQVGQLRLTVAGQGLVGGSGSGYELFDKQSTFGTTNFVQNLNAKRALEGELARTIGTLPAVQGARVHVVLPKQTLFSREQTPPSAAVALNLGNRMLEPGQVQSIAQLVAAAVPNLTPRNITVIDQRGNLLFNGQDAEMSAGSANKVRRDVEKSYEDALATLLERIVGTGKVAVRVTAELNLDQVRENSELFDPTQQVVRSEQTVESSNKSADTGGQAPVGVQGNIPGDAAAAGAGGSNSAENRTETTTNYEISKTVRQLTKEGGDLKRLSVAVLVEGKTVSNDKGEVTYTPLSEAERANIRRLVESAVGYTESRGDKIEIVDTQFSAPPEPPALEDPLMSKDQMIQLAETVLLVVALLVVALLVVRPALGLLMRSVGTPVAGGVLPPLQDSGPLSAPGELVTAGGGDSMVNMTRVEGRVRESSVKRANEIVDQHPEETLAIVRGWMSDTSSGSSS